MFKIISSTLKFSRAIKLSKIVYAFSSFQGISNKIKITKQTSQVAYCNYRNENSWKSSFPKKKLTCFENSRQNKNSSKLSACLVLSLSILQWLGFEEEDKEKESELIMTLKRAVLSTRRQEYNKAEQLLHIALRLAQQQQNEQGITYCFDLMANLAFETLQLEKSEKLFVSVLQRLLSTGIKEDDLKVIHISLKLARILHLKAEEEKAELGYQWCIEQISKQKNKSSDAKVLYGVIQDWYAQFLLDSGQLENSLKHLKEAYEVCIETMGNRSEESMLLLNDLGITCWRAGDLDTAEKFLHQAVAIGLQLEDKMHVGTIHANLGLIYLQRGITGEANKYCKQAWHLGKKHEDNEALEQANYCFDQLKVLLENKSSTPK